MSFTSHGARREVITEHQNHFSPIHGRRLRCSLTVLIGAWPIEIIAEKDRQRIELKNAALSAAGTGIQGSHIVHPDGDDKALPWKHVWLTPATAAAIWSTALMLLLDPDLLDLSEIKSLFTEDESGIKMRSVGKLRLTETCQPPDCSPSLTDPNHNHTGAPTQPILVNCWAG